MKILLTIHHHLNPHSGAPGTVLKLGQAYQSAGHDVDYYAFDNLPKQVKSRLPRLLFPEFLGNYLLKHGHQYDVVDASTGDAWLWGSVFRKLHHKRPLLVTRSHGLEHIVHLEYLEEVRKGNEQMSWKYPLYRGSFQLWEVTQSLLSADLSFLLNQEDLKYAVESLGISTDKAYVTHNGIPDDFLNLPIDPTPRSSDADLGIVQIGTYIPRKGIQYSVPALNHILQRYSQVKLSLLGTGCPVEKVLKDFDESVWARIKVIPHFEHNQLPKLLNGNHIKLFTPLAEGFGKALVEAMACGLAPVTTATPGPLEVVRDGHDALLIPLRDSQAIELALERFICDRDYLNQIRQNAYQTAQQYGWSQIAQKRITLYQDAIAKQA
ncbi:MAG: glycosyltransferase family 4 protein [Leptolyngbya sp. SIO3F4]|nr:glycosyltransferase family 4 protein [Leptolyngbya sp. SIO3F4]